MLYTSYVFSEHFYTSLYGLTEVLTVLQCSLKSPYTNSQIYSSWNIFPTASRFLYQTGLPCTGMRIGTRTRPHRSVPTDLVLGFFSRSGRCWACLSTIIKPIILLIVDETLKILFQRLVGTLSLAICLRMIARRKLNRNVEMFEHVLPKLWDELWTTITNNIIWQTWCLNTSRITRSVVSWLVIDFVHGKKCAILVNQSTTVRIASNLLKLGDQ